MGQMSISSFRTAGTPRGGGDAVAAKRKGKNAMKVDRQTIERRDQKLLRMRAVLGQEFPRESDQVLRCSIAQFLVTVVRIALVK